MYEGYYLPKGTIVFANTWSINRDEEEYEAGDEFIPERFLQNKFGSRRKDAGTIGIEGRLTPLVQEGGFALVNIWQRTRWYVALPRSFLGITD